MDSFAVTSVTTHRIESARSTLRSRRWSLVAALCRALPRRGATRSPELIAKVNASYPGVQAAREGVEPADAQLSQANRLWWPTGHADLRHHGIARGALRRSGDRRPWPDAKLRQTSSARRPTASRTDVVDLRSG